jgi:large subunit ribosomal protein L22
MAKQEPAGKAAERPEKRDSKKEFHSCHRFARISPRKVRYVMDLVRGLPVERALDDLRFSTKRATPMIRKVIQSALANATQEAGLETSNLFISQALVDVGPRIKRFKPRAMGRAYPRLRRTCHISVVLSEMTDKEREQKEKRDRKQKKKAAAPGTEGTQPAASAPAGRSPKGTPAAPSSGGTAPKEKAN